MYGHVAADARQLIDRGEVRMHVGECAGLLTAVTFECNVAGGGVNQSVFLWASEWECGVGILLGAHDKDPQNAFVPTLPRRAAFQPRERLIS